MLTIATAGYDGGAMAEQDTIDFLFAITSSSVHRIQEHRRPCTTCCGS